MIKSLFMGLIALGLSTTVQASNPATSTLPVKAKKAKQAAPATTKAAPAPASAVSTAAIATLPTASANLSITSVMMHASEGRTMVQVNPVSKTGTQTLKFKSTPAYDESVTTQAMGVEVSRGLSNGMALNVSTDIGSYKTKEKDTPEIANTGFSDVKVQITKLNQTSMNQTYLTGFATTSLGKGAIGAIDDGKAYDGNRFSGGISLGGEFVRQFQALAGTYGYRLGGALVMPRSQDIQNSTPVYAVLETTGGHKLYGEFFGQTAPRGKWMMGASASMNTTLAEEYSTRIGTFGQSASRNQHNILGLKAFAAFSSGQIEFVPAMTLERGLNASGGDFAIESMDNLGLQLTTRLSL